MMEKKTNFQMVSAFNELIGNAKGAANINQIKNQYQMILSEMNELGDAISAYEDALRHCEEEAEEAARDIRDGMADVLVTTYGLAHRIGVEADADMLVVCESNDSKFFKGSEEEAAQMCKALADSLGIQVEARERFELGQKGGEGPMHSIWAFVSADDSDLERPRGKLLKAPGYRPPVFS